MVLEVVRNSFRLVGGDGIDITEATAGAEGGLVRMACGVDDCTFGLVHVVSGVHFCSANVGEVWTGVGPGGGKDCIVRADAAVRAAVAWRASYTVVTRSVEDGYALKAELEESGAVRLTIRA